MLETISAIICVLFIIIGLVEVFRSIVLFVLRPKGEDTAMTIVPICGHNEEAEYLLRSAAARVKWADNGRERRVICLDCGMDLETRMILRKVGSFLWVYGALYDGRASRHAARSVLLAGPVFWQGAGSLFQFLPCGRQFIFSV